MYLPEILKKTIYTYSSSVITINLSINQNKLFEDIRIFTLEGPFIGKYYAIISENEAEIRLYSFGKGLFYGRIDEKSKPEPIFILNKVQILTTDIKIPNGYILSCFENSTTLRLNNINYEGCKLFKLTYENGSYTIYIKEDLGILLIRNTKNNKITEEITIKEI